MCTDMLLSSRLKVMIAALSGSALRGAGADCSAERASVMSTSNVSLSLSHTLLTLELSLIVHSATMLREARSLGRSSQLCHL